MRTQQLDVGNGILVGEKDGRVSLAFGHMVSDVKELMNKVFLNLRNQFADHNWLKTCGILAPKNVAVDDLKFKLLELLPDERHIYNTINAVLNIEEAVNYPVEFLNILTPPGLPPHYIHLEIWVLVILLRNIDSLASLQWGTTCNKEGNTNVWEKVSKQSLLLK